eukprot:1301248-Alexandrium_andersonii.AAC.1
MPQRVLPKALPCRTHCRPERDLSNTERHLEGGLAHACACVHTCEGANARMHGLATVPMRAGVCAPFAWRSAFGA